MLCITVMLYIIATLFMSHVMYDSYVTYDCHVPHERSHVTNDTNIMYDTMCSTLQEMF